MTIKTENNPVTNFSNEPWLTTYLDLKAGNSGDGW